MCIYFISYLFPNVYCNTTQEKAKKIEVYCCLNRRFVTEIEPNFIYRCIKHCNELSQIVWKITYVALKNVDR